MDCSTPGLPVHHQFLELALIHVHQVGGAIQPSNPLSLPSPPALSLSQHKGLFQRVSSSHQVAKVLEFQLQHQSFQWIFRTDFLQDWLVWSPCCPRDSQESSPTLKIKSINSSALSFLCSPTLPSIHVQFSSVAQSCPTLCDPMDCSPLVSSVHRILQARILEWVAIPFSRRSSQPRDWTQVSSIAGRSFTSWATREAFMYISSIC